MGAIRGQHAPMPLQGHIRPVDARKKVYGIIPKRAGTALKREVGKWMRKLDTAERIRLVRSSAVIASISTECR